MSRRPIIIAAAVAAAVTVPAVATGAAKPQPQDQFKTNGSNQYFTWYGYGNTTNKTGIDSGLAAKGKIAFRFAKKNEAYPGLEIYADVTLLRVDGNIATLAGKITGNYKAGPLEGLGDKGQYVEFSIRDNATGKDAVSSVSFTGDSADAFTDYDTDFPSAAKSVTLYDRYTAPVAPEPDPTPEPTPEATPTPTATPAPTVTPAPTPTPEPTPTVIPN